MNYTVRFYSLQNFKVIRTENFTTLAEAKAALQNHATSGNFTKVKFVDDDDYTIRATATTPNGRAGRNIGAIDLGYDGE